MTDVEYDPDHRYRPEGFVGDLRSDSFATDDCDLGCHARRYPVGRWVRLTGRIGYVAVMGVRSLDHIVLTVVDVERSLAWYTEVLGLAPERVDAWRAGEVPFPSVRVDDSCVIDLFAGSGSGSGSNLDHFCLVVDADDVASVVSDPRFEVVDGPGPRWGARGVGTWVYVSDPDGNTVELRSYT